MRIKAGILMTVFLLLSIVLAGCSAVTESGEVIIAAAQFPEYDWIRQILGSETGIRPVLLIDSGVDAHSYQPTAADILTVSHCNLLVYGGGESESWLSDTLAASNEIGFPVVNMMEELGSMTLSSIYTEGMQIRAKEDEADEHFRLSLRCASVCCKAIAEQMCLLWPEKAETFRQNLSEYLDALAELDQEYEETVVNARTNTILVGDRFPYRYLAADYSLNFYAAFPGCSAESGASFSTIIFLAEKMQELGLRTVIIPEGSDGRIAQTLTGIIGLPDNAVITLNSMQSISSETAQRTSYLSIMQENRQALALALQ